MKTAQGAIVDEPQAGSPAAKAGIKAGDVITAVNGTQVKDARDLARTSRRWRPGPRSSSPSWRNGQETTMTLALGELPAERQAHNAGEDHGSTGGARLGLTLAPANEVEGAGTKGVAVTEVNPQGPAAEQGIQTGDVILDVGGKAVSKPADVRQGLADLNKAGKHTVLLRVKSGDNTRFVAVPLDKA